MISYLAFLILTIFIILFILTRISSSLKFHIKYIGLGLTYIFLTLICAVFTLLRPGSSKNIFIPQFCAWLIRMEWLFGLDIQIENLDYLKNIKKPVVIVTNHQTIIDPLILFKLVPNNSTAIAKKSLLYVPVFGVVCWLYGVFFIDRSKRKSAMETMAGIALQMNKKKTNVCVFPEGTRAQHDKIGEFKKGAFHLAIQAQVPIVPVVIGNYRYVIDTNNRLFEGGVIRVKVLPAVVTEVQADVNELLKTVHDIMSTGFNEDFKNHIDEYKDLIPLKDD